MQAAKYMLRVGTSWTKVLYLLILMASSKPHNFLAETTSRFRGRERDGRGLGSDSPEIVVPVEEAAKKVSGIPADGADFDREWNVWPWKPPESCTDTVWLRQSTNPISVCCLLHSLDRTNPESEQERNWVDDGKKRFLVLV